MASHGDAKSDAFWVIGFFIVLGLLWYVTGGPNHPDAESGPLLPPAEVPISSPDSTIGTRPPPAPSLSKEGVPEVGVVGTSDTNSTYSGQVRLEAGNAQSEIQPNQEYITLYSNSQTPIAITGWRLTSNRQKVAYQSPSVVIPLGVKVYDPRQSRRLEPIVLQPGDEANIITGQINVSEPYLINVSFKTNECSGYLGSYPDYQFSPSLYSNCPASTRAPNYDLIDESCTNFIEQLSSCHTPDFTPGEGENGNYVDGSADLTYQCKQFLKANYSYQACLDRYRSQSDFLGQTWYVYLNRIYEMWGQKNETVSLYDQYGLLVDQLSY